MFKIAVQALVVVLVILIKTAFSPFFANFSFYPDLVFIFVFSWVISKPLREEFEFIFLTGLLLDFFSGGTLGVHALAFLLSIFLSLFLYRNLFHLHKVVLPLIMFLAFFFYNLLLIGVDLFISPQGITLDLGLWQKTARIILSDLILASLIYPLVSKIKKELSLKKELKLT